MWRPGGQDRSRIGKGAAFSAAPSMPIDIARARPSAKSAGIKSAGIKSAGT